MDTVIIIKMVNIIFYTFNRILPQIVVVIINPEVTIGNAVEISFVLNIYNHIMAPSPYNNPDSRNVIENR